MAEESTPAVVNISTTQVVKGPEHGMDGAPPQRPSGECNLLNEFLERFLGDSSSQWEVRQDSLGSGFSFVLNTMVPNGRHETGRYMAAQRKGRAKGRQRVGGAKPACSRAAVSFNATLGPSPVRYQ
jgi:hypothetical protein